VKQVETRQSSTPDEIAEANQDRYGPEFCYDEFKEMPSKRSALAMSISIVIGMFMITFVSPVRALVKKYLAVSGAGPSQEYVLQLVLCDMKPFLLTLCGVSGRWKKATSNSRM